MKSTKFSSFFLQSSRTHNKENFEITWDDLSSFLTEEVNHNELIGNSTNYKRGIQAVDYVTRVKDYYYLILGLGCN